MPTRCSFLFAAWVVLSAPALAQPMPRAGEFVVDTSGQLTDATRFELNQIAGRLKASGKGQLGVLVVDTTAGESPRRYALRAFNAWGIGHAGRDDGVLLFAALGDRKAEILLGSGVDSDEDVARSDAVMRDRVIAGFRQRDPNAALLGGARGIVELLEQTALNRGFAPLAALAAPPDSPRFPVSLSRSSRVVDPDAVVPAPLERQLSELAWAQEADGLPPLVFLFFNSDQHQPHQVAGWAREELRLSEDEWLVVVAPRRGLAAVSAPQVSHPALEELAQELGNHAGQLFAEVNDPAAQDAFSQEAQKLPLVARHGVYPRSAGERMSRTLDKHRTGVWASLGGMVVVGGLGLRRWARRRPRTCQDCQTPRELLDEAWDDAHLTVGQKKEEQLQSVEYDVWWCGRCRDALVLRYGTLFTTYSKCGSCSHVTKKNSTRTLVAANYDHGGTVEVTEHCEHCGYQRTYQRHTARLTRSSSSSSSSRSSFGGGSSSGRGSSGSW
ncbi:MAG: TPM domain-containing protein [Myxococcota bacterium]|nr:TPM domain-containing protein [Myxococcota bacterium]